MAMASLYLKLTAALNTPWFSLSCDHDYGTKIKSRLHNSPLLWGEIKWDLPNKTPTSYLWCHIKRILLWYLTAPTCERKMRYWGWRPKSCRSDLTSCLMLKYCTYAIYLSHQYTREAWPELNTNNCIYYTYTKWHIQVIIYLFGNFSESYQSLKMYRGRQ